MSNTLVKLKEAWEILLTMDLDDGLVDMSGYFDRDDIVKHMHLMDAIQPIAAHIKRLEQKED